MANEISGTIEYINAGSANYAIAASAYGYCTTLADQPAKTVDMAGFILNKGVTIHVKFQYNNTASNPTLNINNTGAKPIVIYGTTRVGTIDNITGWHSGAVISFTYDGTNWIQSTSGMDNISTQNLIRPSQLNGVNDITVQSLFNDVRANRLAFLPADQIIIEKTIDGGTTWVDAQISDGTKTALFSETRASIQIPQINGEINTQCGLRVTFTAMKYNVPEGTPETEKYNYWNKTYVNTTERYNQIKLMYFWVSSARNAIKVSIFKATGATPNNWITVYNNNNYGLTGWSGNDFVSFNQSVFGGGVNQTTNYWNWRIVFMSCGPNGSSTLEQNNITSIQSISEIRGYGDTWWTQGNKYAASDHLYSWDWQKNATFPAKLTATNFVGPLTGNASSATEFSSNTTVKLTGDVIGESAGSKKGWSITTTIEQGKITNAMLAGSIANNKLVNSSITVGNKTISLGDTGTLDDIIKAPTSIGTNSSWDITTTGAYYVASGSAFTGTNNPGTNQNAPYTYGALYVMRAGNGGAVQFYISDNASNAKNKANGIRYRSGWDVVNSTNRWRSWATVLDDKNYNLYSPTLTGEGASGNWAITADKANKDGSGNNIVDTYLTKAAGVTNIIWDSTNKKFVKTIDGTNTDIVAGTTLINSVLGTTTTTEKKFLKDTGNWTQVDWEDLTGKPSSETLRNQLFPLTTYTKTLTLTTEWQDTGITGGDLNLDGTYIIQLFLSSTGTGSLSSYSERYSGIMSWYKSMTNNNNVDEIVLHRAGHASNNNCIYLRTKRVSSTASPNTLQLQIKASKNTTVEATLNFKFRWVLD